MYIEFNCAHALQYDYPTISSICAFLHYLVLKYPNPSTILNNFGAVCSVLTRMNIDIRAFSSIHVRDFVQSIKQNIRHVPNRKLPVSYVMLIDIITHIYFDPEGPSVVLAVLLMYFLFLRQSNICPRNKSAFDRHRHLTRGDVILRPDGLVVGIKWSKTRQTTFASSAAAPALPGAITCPVMAYQRMLAIAPTVNSHQALVCFRDSSPLPLSYVKKVWDRALAHLGLAKGAYSLHSLRRGGASDIFNSGAASIQDIRQHGDWRSDSVYAYLPNDPSTSRVFQTFKNVC